MKRAALFRAARVLTGLAVLTGFAAAGAGFGVPLLARGALVPSLIAGTLYAALFWCLAAFLGGRFYCACFCPLGVWQDVWSIFRKRYKPRPDRKKLRIAVLAIVSIAAACGFLLPLVIMDPYSCFGRFGDRILRPGAVWLSDFLWGTLRMESVTPLEAHTFSWPVFLWTAAVMLLLGFMALWKGRWYCDTLCPAGTLLGLIAKGSRYRLQIVPEKCVQCGKCEILCRTGAIHLAHGGIDFARCVLCGECAAVCPKGAIGYRKRRKESVPETPEQPSRREFLIAAGAAGTAAAVGLLAKNSKSVPDPMPVMPPGAVSFAHFHQHCTGCGLCAAACTGKTLTPALFEYGLSGMGQMRLSFELGRCEFECRRCSKVCPTGALKTMTLAAKQRRKIGSVAFFRERCIVVRNGQDCGACAEHCPTGALQMVQFKGTLTVPQVIPELCIGCGSCQYICPVRPLQAMIVTGVPEQTVAADPAKVLKKNGNSGTTGDFPF